jgi:hypothetical protein
VGYITNTETIVTAEKHFPVQSRYEKLKALGLCPGCGKNPPKENRAQCKDCLAAGVAYMKKSSSKRKLLGMCAWSGCKSSAEENRTLCRPHLDDLNIRNKKRAQQRTQAGLCRQCGEVSMYGLIVCEKCLPRKTDLPPMSVRRELKKQRGDEEKARQEVLSKSRTEFLTKYLPCLKTTRQKEIALKRLWEQRTLNDIAMDYGLTRERIRQIETKIVRVIGKAALENEEVNIPISKIEKYCSQQRDSVHSQIHE